MINEENLSKLYSGVLDGTELTTKQMNGYGFNSKDLKELIEEGSIDRVKRGLYYFKSIDKLFHYGKYLITKNQHDKATLCFEKCHELDPTHLGACFQLFLRSIKKEDYKRAFELYERLSKSDNEFYNIDTNYYLYLLSIITEVPEKYKNYARNLKYEDIKIQDTDKRYQDISLQNKVRIAVVQRKFPYAIKQLNDLVSKHGKITLQDIITKTLLSQAITVEKLSKDTIISLIKEKKYEEAAQHLLDKKERHNLSLSEQYILKLVNKYIEIKNTSKIPERSLLQSETLFEAIDANNYSLALKINKEFNEKNNIINESSTINLLLTDICNLINNIEKNSLIINDDKKLSDPIIEESQKEVENLSQVQVSFSSVISFLMKNDLDNTFLYLRKYMKLIDKTDFEFLVIDLIKISLFEKDLEFTKPMIVLSLLSKDNYSFDISSFIQEFYIALSQNKFDEARIYLDIISKSNKLGQECIITDSLYQVLELSEKSLNYKRDNTVIGKVEKAIQNSTHDRVIETTVVSNNTSVVTQSQIGEIQKDLQTSMAKQSVQVEISQELIDSEKEFIKARHEELAKKGGMCLLRPMDNAEIDRIFDMIDEYPDMVAFVIEEGNQQQVVLRYKPVINEHFDINNLIDLGNQAYSVGNYDECIEDYLQLLQIFSEPKSITYSKLGLSYMKKSNIPLAIDYLTVANALAKKEKKEMDFSDLILRLKRKIPKNDIKPRFKMLQEDFDYSDVNNFYGIENFDEINSFITSSGMDVESACKQLNMTPEQIDIIKLIYAREFYIQGDLEKGNLFLNSAEKSKNKSKATVKIIDEVRRNKKFYKNRKVERSRQLSLSLIPKKK